MCPDAQGPWVLNGNFEELGTLDDLLWEEHDIFRLTLPQQPLPTRVRNS
jgi:hypothetical protein